MNNFDKEFSRMKKIHNIMFAIVSGFIALSMVAAIGLGLWFVFQLNNVSSTVQEDGIKAVLESYWCGNKGCN